MQRTACSVQRSEEKAKRTLFVLIVLTSFINPVQLVAQRGSSLELQYALLYDDAWNDLRGRTVEPGSELTLQMKYTRKGFPEDSKTMLKIQIFDAEGNVVLEDEEDRPSMEGTRLDRYRFTIPKKISGKFLASLTISVLGKERILAEVNKTVPFNVKVE